MKRRTESHWRSVLRERLEAKRQEIEDVALTRATAIADPGAIWDPAYADGLRISVTTAVDYALEAIGRERGYPPPIPVALLAQARLAARNGITLDTVLRRYLAGHSLFSYLMVEEAGHGGLATSSDLQRLLCDQANALDRLLEAIGEEHRREWEARPTSIDQRHTKQIERLLDGGLVDTTSIAYDFGGYHLGVIVADPDATGILHKIGGPLDLRTLVVDRREDSVAWGWFGSRRRDELSTAQSSMLANLDTNAIVVLGEPGHGISGWRLSHRQAATALQLARRLGQTPLRYADVALLASINQDALLSVSLQQLYLEPLRANRDGGKVAKETLRAYFAAGRNVSSAAASLGVKRHTVTRRLRTIEVNLGHSMREVATELEAALHLENLGVPRVVQRTRQHGP